MAYVDGFVAAVSKDRLEEYRLFSVRAGEVWMEHGARSYNECISDDVPYGERTSFPRAVQATDDEVVVFSWITYDSREHRDAVNARVFTDPRLQPDKFPMPFDGKRMIFGGFQPIVQM